jgi:TolB protein
MAMRGGEDWDVYTMALDGSDERRLTDSLAHDGYPSWSPDGRFVAFDSDRAGSTDVWVVPAEGGPAVRITDHPESEQAPVWVERP